MNAYRTRTEDLEMNAADTVNLVGTILKTLEQDPLSFMVVYPMALMTTSVLLYALLQDLIPASHRFLNTSK
ncbi:MAG: hypothetical protein C0507_08560 [Cyanobacteria bacterium PR.3.49]|nr:hypothetical protein [Cyanobacteria bacterium PR.3.49]